MYRRLNYLNTLLKGRNALIILAAAAMFGGVFVSQTDHVNAARATAYVCERQMTWSYVDRAEGRYVTVEYGLSGNDSARAQHSESGAVVPSTGTGPNWANCAVGGDGGWCDFSALSLFWSCNGTIDYNSAFYKTAMFGGGTATEVYLGSAQQSWNDHENYWRNATLLNDDITDPTRRNAGVSASSNYPFATVNDAGKAYINGDQIFCFGLAFQESCHANVFDAWGNGTGTVGSWAGYLNPGPNGGFAVAPRYWLSTMANGVRPSQRLVGGGSFNLQLAGVNTQDPWFGCFPEWNDGIPPGGTNPPFCYKPEPFKNEKVSIMITYFVPVSIHASATPAVQPPTLLPNDEVASSARFNAGVTFSPSDKKFKTTATRSYYIQRGALTIPIAPPDSTWIDTDTNFNNVSRSVNGARVGDQICERLTVTPGSAMVDNDGNVIQVIDARHEAVNCTRMVIKPYLKVYGNDVSAGAEFGANCDLNTLPNNKATILSVLDEPNGETQIKSHGNSNLPDPFVGASTQLAAFALGQIGDFFSGGTHSPRRTSMPESPANGLTFGNYGVPSIDSNSNWDSTGKILEGNKVVGYGGKSGQYRCVPDYYNILTAGRTSSPAAGLNLDTLSAGSYTYRAPASGRLTLNGGASLSGSHVLVVDGDIDITNSIGYGAYSDAAHIPSLYIVARGNIYIRPGVDAISGVFIAEPDTADFGNPNAPKGNIYTCSNAAGTAPEDANNIYNNCDNKLTINGAFMAQNVKFLRTNGSLKYSAENELWNSDHIAEVFKSSPELYLAQPVPQLRSSCSYCRYDSVTSLPPTL